MAEDQIVKVATGKGVYGDIEESMVRVRWYNYYRTPDEGYRRPSQPVGHDPYYCAGMVVPTWFAENTMVQRANTDCTLRTLPRSIVSTRGGWMTGASTGKTWLAVNNHSGFQGPRERSLCAEVLTDALGVLLSKLLKDNVIAKLRSEQLIRIARSTDSQCNRDGSPQLGLWEEGAPAIWQLGKQMNLTARGPREERNGLVEPFPAAFNLQKRSRRQLLPGHWEDLPDLGSAELDTLTGGELAGGELTPLPPTAGPSFFWPSAADETRSRGARRRLSSGAAAAGAIVASGDGDGDATPLTLMSTLGIVTILLFASCASCLLSPSFCTLLIDPLTCAYRRLHPSSRKAARKAARKARLASGTQSLVRDPTPASIVVEPAMVMESASEVAKDMNGEERRRDQGSSKPILRGHKPLPASGAEQAHSISEQLQAISSQVACSAQAAEVAELRNQVIALTRAVYTQQKVLEETMSRLGNVIAAAAQGDGEVGRV